MLEDFAFLAFGFLRGKAFWMKGNCWREIAEGGKGIEGELLASLRAKPLRKLKGEHGTV
jgi:hypothetical protein